MLCNYITTLLYIHYRSCIKHTCTPRRWDLLNRITLLMTSCSYEVTKLNYPVTLSYVPTFISIYIIHQRNNALLIWILLKLKRNEGKMTNIIMEAIDRLRNSLFDRHVDCRYLPRAAPLRTLWYNSRLFLLIYLFLLSYFPWSFFKTRSECTPCLIC